MQSSDFHKGIFLGVATVFFGSLVAAAAKHLGDQVNVATIVIFQYGICLLCTLPWLAKNGVAGLKTEHPWQHLVRGISGCACFYTFYLALPHTPMVDATVLRNTAPLLVPLVALVWLRIAVPGNRWPPLILGFLGVLVILRPGQEGMGWWHLVGFASGLTLAISMVSTRLLSATEPESRILFYYFAISIVFAVPFFILNYQPVPLSALPWLIGIGLVMYFTFVIYTRAYAYVKASILAPTSYFAVVFAGVWDFLFWRNLPDIWVLAGMVLVVGGGLMMLRLNNEAGAANKA